MSNILDNAGQVIFASAVIPPLFGFDQESSKVIPFIGIVVTIFFWWGSLRLERISSL